MLIETRDISKVYQMGSVNVHALKNINFGIKSGEFVAIMGPSGSGKSTLLHLLGCLDVPTSGQYILEGKDVSHLNDNNLAEIRNKRIGFVFQSYNLLPRLSALDNVELPLLYCATRQSRQKAKEALKTVGLIDRSIHCSCELSGGECQRVAIARAIVTSPALILADEPTGNLDSHTGEEILKLFVQLNQKDATIILVTHDRKIAETAHKIIHLKDGELVNIENLN